MIRSLVLQLDAIKISLLLLRSQPGLKAFGFLIAAEILALSRDHFGHGGVRLAVIICGIPEQESDPALVLRGDHLDLDIFRRVSLGSPAEGLQPGPDDHAAALGDL